MLSIPKLIILPLNGLICVDSTEPTSLYHRIYHPDLLVFKPGVKEAFELILGLEVEMEICGLSQPELTQDRFAKMQDQLQSRLIPLRYCHLTLPSLMLITVGDSKVEAFRRARALHPKVPVEDICVIDPSESECEAAQSLGMMTRNSGNLYLAICEIFSLSP